MDRDKIFGFWGRLLFCNVLLLFFAGCQVKPLDTTADFALYRIYSDNMVIQANKPIIICGTATEGTTLDVTFDEVQRKVVANESGEWKATFPAFSYGGPYQVRVKTNNSQRILNNVMVGEVWICSGQSNMGCTVASADGGADAIKSSTNYPNVRLFKVENSFSFGKKLDDVTSLAQWQTSKPATVANFSSVAYFFAITLNREKNIPVGIIQTQWGGTGILCWLSQQTLQNAGFSKISQSIDRIVEKKEQNSKQDVENYQKYELEFDKWCNSFYSLAEKNTIEKIDWSNPELNTQNWNRIEYPCQIDDNLLKGGDGIVWVRRSFDLPESFLNRELDFVSSPIDDCDKVWINGTLIGETTHKVPNCWSTPRQYTIPAKLLKSSNNTIVIRITDLGGGGGSMGEVAIRNPENNSSISLAGNWVAKTQAFVDLKDLAKRPEAKRPQGYESPSFIYNAMIAPLTKFPAQGVLWYQGEANHRQPMQYMRLLPTLVSSWRTEWQDYSMPFIVIQIPGWDPLCPKNAKKELNPQEYYAPAIVLNQEWKEYGLTRLREVQDVTTKALPNMGLVVTHDLGDPFDVHPTDKIPVGERAAYEAIRLVHNDKDTPRNTFYRTHQVVGDKIKVHFTTDGGKLVSKDGANLKHFTIAGADGKYFHANAKIVGDNIVEVSSANVLAPKNVRYAWNPYSINVNLFNEKELPIAPFRTEKKAYLYSNEYPDSIAP